MSKSRWAAIKRRYGLSKEDWERIYNDQEGLCYICLRPQKKVRRRRLHVDHCHKTGKIRGLLCSRCNLALSNLFDDDPTKAKRVVKYLMRKTSYGTVPKKDTTKSLSLVVREVA